MTYATRDDLEQINGPEEVAQRESMLPENAVTGILEKADELIDGYLAARYSLPLSVTPANLPQIAAQIARYNLLGEAATERARADFKDAIAWLTAVQAGRVVLQAAVPAPGTEPALAVMSCSSPAVFKRGGRP
jgi:phage gp36-like protein